MMGMRKQRAWMRWEGTLEKKISWTEIWQAYPLQIKFLVQSVFDILPSRIISTSSVPWEGFPRAHLKHLPNSPGGGYRCRHDQVLKSIAEYISKAMANNKHSCFTFVRAGEQPHSLPKLATGLFTLASD